MMNAVGEIAGYAPGSIPAFVPRPGTSSESVAIEVGAGNGRAHHRSTSRRSSLEGRPHRPSKLVSKAEEKLNRRKVQCQSLAFAV